MKQGRNLAPANASPSSSLLSWAAGAKKPAPRTIVTDFLRLWWDQDWHLNLCDGELKDQCTLWTLLQYGESCFDMWLVTGRTWRLLLWRADLGLKKVPGEAAALFRKRGVVCESPPPRPRDERRRETGIDWPLLFIASSPNPVFPEEQFHLVADDQIILHRHHKIVDRYGALLREWSWTDYPINNDPADRERLRKLLTEVDFRRANASAIAEDMWEVQGYNTQWRS
jgi:hypothetical protein